MANEIVIAAAEPWDIRVMRGVDRVSGTELGRRLAYCVGKPTMFNKRVIEKLLKEGKLNISDMVTKRLPCKRGFGTSEVTEYWLPLPLARILALNHVWTPAADALRQQVSDELERMIDERRTTLQAPTELGSIIRAGFEHQTALLESQRELLIGLRQPKTPSVYIDEERAHLLKRMAQNVATSSGESSVQPIWQAVQRKFGFVNSRLKANPRVFETVTIDRFDEVLAYLRAELETTRKTVSSLLKRPVAPTGNYLDIQAVSRRVTAAAKVDVPACIFDDWGPSQGLYTMLGITTYDAPATGKKDDAKRAVHIDESSVPPIIDWCIDHPRELECLVSNRRSLDSAISAARNLKVKGPR